MKSKIIKIGTAVVLFSGSAAVLAAQGCCGDIACCIEQLLCCF